MATIAAVTSKASAIKSSNFVKYTHFFFLKKAEIN
jgi:hypothetical protein